jgi:hypothetical protein
MQQQINMDPINNEIKEEEKNDSAISADDSNVNVNLSKRSFTNFASSVKKLMDLNEYIYEDNVLDLEKFHLNHDDELITLVHTIGWWLRNHIDDDETEVKWDLALSSSNNVNDIPDGLHLRNAWIILSNGLTHEEPLVRLHSIYAIIEGSKTLELEEEYNRKLFKVIKSVRSSLIEIIESDEFEPCRLLAVRGLSQVCEWIFKHISESIGNGENNKNNSRKSQYDVSSDETDTEDERDEDASISDAQHPIEILIVSSFSTLLKKLAILFNREMCNISKKMKSFDDDSEDEKKDLLSLNAEKN